MGFLSESPKKNGEMSIRYWLTHLVKKSTLIFIPIQEWSQRHTLLHRHASVLTVSFCSRRHIFMRTDNRACVCFNEIYSDVTPILKVG